MAVNTEQETFEKCWAHSPLRTAIHQVSLLSHAACAIAIDIDVHNNNNDNA